MTIEFERSYVFAHASIPHILNHSRYLNVEYRDAEPLYITDSYLNPHLRIRESVDGFVLTRKTGDKGGGQRIEEESPIDRDTANILSSETKLRVVKRRYTSTDVSSDFRLILDVVEEPMRVVILEIESINDKMPPTASQVLGVDLQECPLSAWNLFRQKVGICGCWKI